jgi:hypothetical protein
VCIALLVLGGCSCGKERGVAEGGYGDAGSGEDTAALPELVPPALDVERALDLFRSIGEGQRPLEIPPLSEDLSQATEEVEPNDRKSEASPMGTARLARGWSERNTYDYFQFEVDGEPRQWLIEVRGASISRAEYSDLGGSRHRLGRIRGQDDVLGAANLVLQPGTHWLYVYGRDTGEYTIRLAEVGRAGEGDDREPNGNARNAAVMRVGESVSGLFYPDDDRDYYRFSLFAKATVRIRLESPVDIKPRVELSNSNGGHQLQIVRWAAREEGGGFEDTRSLLPGDYVIALGAPKSSSRLPYSLAIEAVEPGELVTDLEPNDDIESSRSLPRDGVVQGTLAGTDDFYSLPYLGVDSTLTIAGPVVGPEVGAEVGTEVGTERRESPGAAVTEPVAPVRETPRDIRIYAQPGDKKFVRAAKNPATGLLEVDLPAGSNPHLQLIGSKPYRLELSFDPPLVAREDAELPPIDVKLSAANRRFAAFVDRFQETRLQVAVANRGDRPVEMDLELTSDHFAWRPTLRTTKLALEPGEVQAVEGILEVAPDVWSTQPVRLALQATVSGTTVAGDSLLVFAECGAIAVAPSAKSLLPPALEGGLNVAAQGLGGRLLSEDKRAHARVAGANNGFTYIDEGPGFPLEKGVGDLTVALAGGESVPVVGVLLNPMSTRSTARWLRDFELHLSEDGETFSRALSGTLDRSPREQGFALASPIPARFARLHVLSTYGEGESWGTLGEFKVVAEPGWDLTGGEGFDLASPELGGHVVRTSWRAHFYNHVKAILTNEEEGRSARVDPDNPTEWVIGFHHNRSALIDALEWIDQKEGRSQSFDRVQVAVSTDGPLGPWQPVGTWDLSDDATSARIWELEQSVWARFVRFSNFDADKVGNWALPETLRVRERPSGPDYRSILTEWGEYSREAFYETTMERTASAPAADDDNDSRESADRLHLDRPLAGVVTLGDDEDWYRIDLPADANTLDLEISGDPRLKAVVELADETGSALDWDQETVLAGSAQMSALLGGGRTVFVRVSEPPRSIAFAWDNSGSMGSYLNTIYPAMARFVGEVKPGLEFAKLHPFGGTLFRDDWSDDPTALRYAVENYHRRDHSSSAEPALGLVADELAERQGTRAVVFLTDAKTPSQSRSVEMWSSLGRSSGASGTTSSVSQASGLRCPNTRRATGAPSGIVSSTSEFRTSRATAIRVLPPIRCSMLPEASRMSSTA